MPDPRKVKEIIDAIVIQVAARASEALARGQLSDSQVADLITAERVWLGAVEDCAPKLLDGLDLSFLDGLP